MSGDNYYLLSVLPGLEDPGSTPPMTLSRFLAHVADAEGNCVLVEAVLSGDDLLQFQAYSTEEITEVEPAVLSAEQIRGEAPLPEYLWEPSREDEGSPYVDRLWAAYYRYAAEVAGQQHSEFLQLWIQYEVGLRNALVTARAKSLGLDPQDYLVAEELGAVQEDFSTAVSEWQAASDPYNGQRVLDDIRWNWLIEHDGWFTFADDELAAYGAKLMLLHRWHRLSGQSRHSAESALAE